MKRLTSWRRRWMEVRAIWVGMLWCCTCEYHNVATFRCYFCGAKPPRELRQRVATRTGSDGRRA